MHKNILKKTNKPFFSIDTFINRETDKDSGLLQQAINQSKITAINQADLLKAIGTHLTTRSDTFKIQTYGEVMDAQGKTVASIRFEAIVQRIPKLINKSTPNSRHFKVIAFRWLD